MKKSSIDINQRIPLDVLEIALKIFLKDGYEDNYISEQLHLEFSGENRIKKGLRIVKKIIPENPLKVYILENRETLKTALNNRIDRNVILISLLNSSFPFSFEVLSTFGKYFKVQDIINSEAVKKSISGKYGGNRATENGIYSVIPMFLEANFFSRPKTGVYHFENKLKTTSSISKEIYKQSFRINRQSFASSGLLIQEPYFVFLDLQE